MRTQMKRIVSMRKCIEHISMRQWAGGRPPPGFPDCRGGRGEVREGSSASLQENGDLAMLRMKMRGRGGIQALKAGE